MEILSEEDINEIFKYLETKSENHFRDILIIMVLLECGLRLEEATTLKLQNINIKQNTMKVLGKGNKERIISYGVNVQKMFFKYINQERPEPINKKVEGLFLKSDGSPTHIQHALLSVDLRFILSSKLQFILSNQNDELQVILPKFHNSIFTRFILIYP
ncbi:MAG: tyrosine-type recombinase/integrase, partial [Clostridiaceae bacterium]|nr:tyrosine-type recombinase/integrase [Clostridiaceae bacterium]